MFTRRDFLRRTAGAGLLPLVRVQRDLRRDSPAFEIRTFTRGPKHHFFGYYGIPPWNASQQWMLSLETDFQDRLPEPDEPATIGLVDPRLGTFTPVAETRAWNLQQGAMLHWHPLEPEHTILYNDRRDGRLLSVVRDLNTGEERLLPRPVSAVSPVGGHALSLTYGRLGRLRKVVGYSGAEDPHADEPHPEEDGVFLMDLATGETRLVVSIAEVFRRSVEAYVLAEREMWFNHTVFSRDGKRFLFLARSWKTAPRHDLDSAMFTAGIDGAALRQVVPYGSRVSHFDWRNGQEIVATFEREGDAERVHYLFPDRERPPYAAIGPNFLISDGHCTFAPGGRWLATDRKHGEADAQSLWLYDVEVGEGMLLTQRPMHGFLSGDTRCDFHPRWNRTGDAICFDALDTRDWTRQLHVAHLRFS